MHTYCDILQALMGKGGNIEDINWENNKILSHYMHQLLGLHMRKGLKSKTAVPRLSTTKYILKTYKFSPILIYADLLWGNFCQKFLHFLAKHFQPLNIKMHWRKKIWGRCIWTYFDLFYQRNNITFPSFTKFEMFSYLLNNLVRFASILGQENT